MSVEAITWAFAQPISHSSAKFVLVVLANCADAQHFLAWPSAAYIAQSTGQDRKTVQGNLRRLKEWGYIEDSGERRGETGQIIVYRLKNCNQKTTDNLKNTPENGPVSLNNLSANTPENGPVLPSELSTKTPDFGPLQEAQNRNSTENGTVPFFPRKRPVFPVKEAQKRATEPS